MNKFKNIGYSLLLFLIPVISFSQRASRGGAEDLKEMGPGNPVKPAPIDQYEIALVILAVSIIAFLAYKFYKSKQIAK